MSDALLLAVIFAAACGGMLATAIGAVIVFWELRGRGGKSAGE